MGSSSVEVNVGDERPAIVLEIAEDAPLSEILGAALGLVMRMQDIRSSMRRPAVLPSRLVIEFQPITLTETDQRFLQQAVLTGFKDHERFASPTEVRAFFTPENLHNIGHAGPAFDADVLSAMADVVIRTRRHCQF